MDKPIGLVKPNRRRPEPLWHQAEMALRALIESGEWPPGAQIPNEDRLCELFCISRITVRHALRNLEEAGMLRREHGRGTFARSTTFVAGVRRLTSFTEEMHSLALSSATTLISVQSIIANDEISDALEITPGEQVVQIKRLRLGDGVPIGIQTAHLPIARVTGLIEDAANVLSLYEWLKTRSGIHPLKAKEVYRVGCVVSTDSEFLKVAAGTPAFEVVRITYDSNGPFEYTLSTMRADRYEIRSMLYL